MPNVLSAAPVEALAHRLASHIPDPKAARRFAKLAREQLFADARNFRPATARELKRAPAWAQAAAGSVDTFVAHRSAVARLRRVARRLAAVCDDIAGYKDAAAPPPILAALQAFIAKIDRASFETIDLKTQAFAVERKARIEQEIAATPLYAEIELYSSPGRTWRRIASLRELWRVGCEFRNCLARSSRHNGEYGRRMRDGQAHFWVLRDASGKGLIVLMANAEDKRIVEVRGPRNAIVAVDDADLRQLAIAQGLLGPHDPVELPRPPSRAPAAAAPPPADAILNLAAMIGIPGLRRN